MADRSGLRHDSVVVGRTPPLARVAGALGVLTGVALLVRPFLPLGTAGGHRIGTGLGALGIIGWIPAALVLIVAGAAAAAGRLPRLGLAAIGAAGGLAIGAGVRWVWLTDTSARTPIDLPLPGQAVSLGGYAVGSGLVVAIVGAAAGVLALICSYLAWGSTVMDDDGRFDGWRPAFGSAGLIVGAFGAIAFGTAPSSSAVGASPGGALQATGWLRASDLILIAALVLTCALAPTLRPRVAVVGAWVAVGVVLLGTAIENIVVVDRSPDLHTTLGTVAQPIAAGLVLVLALAAALVRPAPPPKPRRHQVDWPLLTAVAGVSAPVSDQSTGVSGSPGVSGSTGSAAARDPQHRTGDVTRLRPEQPGDGSDHVVGLAGTAERDHRREPVCPAGIATGGVDTGTDHPGRDRIDPDPVATELLRQPDGQRIDGGLGGGVVHVLVRRTESGRRRRHVDDRATGATTAGRHRQGGGAAGEDHAGEVDVDDPVDHLDRCIGEVADVRGQPGVVDQPGRRTELGDGTGEELVDPVPGSDVGPHRERPAAGRADLRGDRAYAVLVGAIAEYDVVPGER